MPIPMLYTHTVPRFPELSDTEIEALADMVAIRIECIDLGPDQLRAMVRTTVEETISYLRARNSMQ